MRYSVKELLIIVTICAFASVTLVKLNPIYVSLFFSFTLLMIGASMLFSIATIGSTRLFWIGFAVISGAYLHLAFSPDENGDYPRRSGREVTTFILQIAFDKVHWPYFNPTTPGGANGLGGPPQAGNSGGGLFSIPDEIDRDSDNPQPTCDKEIARPDVDAPYLTQFGGTGLGGSVSGGGQNVNPGVLTTTGGSLTDFMLVGHSFFALLLGWNAGHVTRFVYERSRQQLAKAVVVSASRLEGTIDEPNPF